MKIGIIGLGLIGGSLARAYKQAGFSVVGFDQNPLTTQFAEMADAIDAPLTDENMNECDCIMIAIPPVPAVKWMEEKAPEIAESVMVIDCCGTKRRVCEAGFRLAEEYGFTYVGGHPMAGLQFGGFKNSRYDLFEGAPFAVVTGKDMGIEELSKMRKIIHAAGFDRIIACSAEEHDKIIAFTSQMAHVVSNAFIKSQTALDDGVAISAGSYRDFTRVAYLDADMWTELFMENRDNLKFEIDTLIDELQEYSKALEDQDAEKMRQLLVEGRERKVEVEKKCRD
ncbi:MAG: prephenate dehydrogenase/arogenate dehydrogenase family protein [Clostridia bacterium]|nr:prephenate dehydrogenase/arogenate dehydrogenase family protein [Clostridia bacterium]